MAERDDTPTRKVDREITPIEWIPRRFAEYIQETNRKAKILIWLCSVSVAIAVVALLVSLLT
jgi:hypothetical protein